MTAAEDVPSAFGRALGVERADTQRWPDRLVEALGEETLVLMVDNAEHVVEATAPLVAELVAGTDIVVVTTSRMPLGLPGEQRWVVEPLEQHGPAFRLFDQRARAVRRAWDPTPGDARCVDVICRRVDGLPLGIELAAAQLQWRTPAEIAASLDRPLDALQPVSGGRGRHAGVRAVIDSSYELLDGAQQSYLDQLGVFAGGFTAATAAQVVESGDGDTNTAARHIGSLVERSLVRAFPRPSGTRYALLDAIRHYAIERLERADRLVAARARHADAMLELTERAARQMWGPDEPIWVAHLDDERADICAAHRHLLERGEDEVALRLATAAYWVAWPRGWSDLRRLIRETVPSERAVAPEVLALALGAAADAAHQEGDAPRALDLANRSLTVAADRAELTYLANSVLGDLALFSGDSAEAFQRWRSAADGWTAALPGLAPWATAATSIALAYGGRDADAEVAAARAVEDADRLGCPTSRAFARYVAAEACARSDPERATSLLAEAVTIASSASTAFVANLARLTLATLTSRQGADPASAVGHYTVILQEWRRGGQWTQQWTTLRTLVPVLARLGAIGEAATLLGGLRAHGRAASWGVDAVELDEADGRLRDALGEEYDSVLDRRRDPVAVGPRPIGRARLEPTGTLTTLVPRAGPTGRRHGRGRLAGDRLERPTPRRTPWRRRRGRSSPHPARPACVGPTRGTSTRPAREPAGTHE